MLENENYFLLVSENRCEKALCHHSSDSRLSELLYFLTKTSLLLKNVCWWGCKVWFHLSPPRRGCPCYATETQSL